MPSSVTDGFPRSTRSRSCVAGQDRTQAGHSVQLAAGRPHCARMMRGSQCSPSSPPIPAGVHYQIDRARFCIATSRPAGLDKKRWEMTRPDRPCMFEAAGNPEASCPYPQGWYLGECAAGPGGECRQVCWTWQRRKESDWCQVPRHINSRWTSLLPLAWCLVALSAPKVASTRRAMARFARLQRRPSNCRTRETPPPSAAVSQWPRR